MGADIQIKCGFNELPFKTTLNFELLINEIKAISKNESHPMQVLAESLLSEINQYPELKDAVCPNSVLEEHDEVIKKMMVFVVNPLNESTEIAGAQPPFNSAPFYATSSFYKYIGAETKKLELAKDIDQDTLLISKLYHAYLIILDQVYEYKIDVELPFTFRVTDQKDNSICYFKKNFSTKYLKVKVLKKRPKLTKEDITTLFDNTEDLNLWNEKIPLEHFEFSGFLPFSYINVTQDYVISQLKSDLLDKNTVVTDAGFEKITKRMRALFENPDLEFGMAVTPDMDASLNEELVWRTIIPRTKLKCTEYRGTFYEKAFMENRIIQNTDIQQIKEDHVAKAFLEKGIRSHAIVPLLIDETPVGMLEFACKKPESISIMHVKRLHEVFPTFALALQRSKEEWQTRISAIIQEEFTAIHPTVEWRFREAVAHQAKNNPESESVAVEPIVFPDVVPIYGASDIRGSSIERNKGIQADLTEQLEHAKKILEQGKSIKDMPLLDDVSYKISEHIKTVKSGLKAGDEVVILEFLKRDVDPLLMLLKLRYAELEKIVQAYFDTLDPELHVLYKKRKDFENSLTIINDKVGEIIDQEQTKAQDVFPHYFEKYRTDGLEYNAYIGQSLVRDLEYNEIYLKNIRLWQLLVKVKVARKIRELQPQLPTKLDITQLILVHSNPLSITFRQDEKKFDVAGAYNIRYEITKKRIDKALINGTNERVTQVGKIAIIYSHANEIREYKKYLDYMIAQGFIKSNIEELELEDLKGASGLRALRIEVDFSDPIPNLIDPAEIKEVVGSN